MNEFIKLVVPHLHCDIFSDFPEILRLKKCDQYLCLEFFFNNTIFVMEKLDLLDQYRIKCCSEIYCNNTKLLPMRVVCLS